MSDTRIMYCCTFCADNNPEMCGYFDRDNLRVMPDGRWLCDSCFDEAWQDRQTGEETEAKCWSDFPAPTEYGPVVTPAEGK